MTRSRRPEELEIHSGQEQQEHMLGERAHVHSAALAQPFCKCAGEFCV